MSRTSRAGTIDSPRYAVRAVAERVGAPTATLRSWNQRYGIGPADHDRGRHRRYSAADIATVQLMHRLMGEGADPRSAAVFDLDLVRVGTLLDRHVRHYGVVET